LVFYFSPKFLGFFFFGGQKTKRPFIFFSPTKKIFEGILFAGGLITGKRGEKVVFPFFFQVTLFFFFPVFLAGPKTPKGAFGVQKKKKNLNCGGGTHFLWGKTGGKKHPKPGGGKKKGVYLGPSVWPGGGRGGICLG